MEVDFQDVINSLQQQIGSLSYQLATKDAIINKLQKDLNETRELIRNQEKEEI